MEKSKPQLDLSKYGIEDVGEKYHNLSYKELFEHETNPDLEDYEKGILLHYIK